MSDTFIFAFFISVRRDKNGRTTRKCGIRGE